MKTQSKLIPHLIAIGVFVIGSTIGLLFGNETGRPIVIVLFLVLIIAEACIWTGQVFSNSKKHDDLEFSENDDLNAHILVYIHAFDDRFELNFHDNTEIIIKYENLQKFYIHTYSYAQSKKYAAKYCLIFTTSPNNFFRLGETQQVYNKFIVRFREELYNVVSKEVDKAIREIEREKQNKITEIKDNLWWQEEVERHKQEEKMYLAWKAEMERTKSRFHFTADEEDENRRIVIRDEDFNQMDGYGFERYVGHLLLKKGYKNITVTQKSGDFGVDITAERDSIIYAIQCKYYTGPVGVNAVNEVKGGMAHYHAHVGVVITNSSFTKQAIQLAKENKIILWNVAQLLDGTENNNNQ